MMKLHYSLSVKLVDKEPDLELKTKTLSEKFEEESIHKQPQSILTDAGKL